MSAPPFFQSAKKGDLLFGGEKEGPTVVGDPVRTRKSKLAGREKHDARLGRAVQVNKRGGGNPLM